MLETVSLDRSGLLDTLYRIIETNETGTFNPYSFSLHKAFKEHGIKLFQLTNDHLREKREVRQHRETRINDILKSAYQSFLQNEAVNNRLSKEEEAYERLKHAGLVSGPSPKEKLTDILHSPGGYQLNLEEIDSIMNNLKEYIDAYTLNYIITSFKGYLKSCETPRYVVAERGKKVRFIPLNNRFSPERQHRLKKRMKYLIATRGNQNAVMLTLTLDPSLFNDRFSMWQSIKPELHRFLTSLRKALKGHLPEYLATIEAQKNGNPHIHIVFFNAKRLIDWRRIRDLWGLGHIFINRTSDNSKVRYPISYVCKYITKTYTTSNNDNVLTQSLVWLFGVRSYSCSRGLLYPLYKKSPLKWSVEWLIAFDMHSFEYSPSINDSGGEYG